MVFNFAELWESGAWRKLGRRKAATLFHREVKTEQDWKDIQAARDEYNAYCAKNASWYQPQQGAVWFGTRKGWREWVPDEVELKVDEIPELLAGSQHWHTCAICEPNHRWIHDDELCCISHDVICPKAFMEFKGRVKASAGTK